MRVFSPRRSLDKFRSFRMGLYENAQFNNTLVKNLINGLSISILRNITISTISRRKKADTMAYAPAIPVTGAIQYTSPILSEVRYNL